MNEEEAQETMFQYWQKLELLNNEQSNLNKDINTLQQELDEKHTVVMDLQTKIWGLKGWIHHWPDEAEHPLNTISEGELDIMAKNYVRSKEEAKKELKEWKSDLAST